jgi:hypothetical protein
MRRVATKIAIAEKIPPMTLKSANATSDPGTCRRKISSAFWSNDALVKAHAEDRDDIAAGEYAKETDGDRLEVADRAGERRAQLALEQVRADQEPRAETDQQRRHDRPQRPVVLLNVRDELRVTQERRLRVPRVLVHRQYLVDQECPRQNAKDAENRRLVGLEVARRGFPFKEPQQRHYHERCDDRQYARDHEPGEDQQNDDQRDRGRGDAAHQHLLAELVRPEPVAGGRPALRLGDHIGPR